MKVLIVAHVIARLLLDKIIHLRELNIWTEIGLVM